MWRFNWKPYKIVPTVRIDISCQDLNAFVCDHFTDGEFDTICVAFADDLRGSELYFVMEGSKGIFVIVDESASNIQEQIFIDEPKEIDFRHFEDEYQMYLAKFEVYCNFAALCDDVDELRRRIMICD